MHSLGSALASPLCVRPPKTINPPSRLPAHPPPVPAVCRPPRPLHEPAIPPSPPGRCRHSPTARAPCLAYPPAAMSRSSRTDADPSDRRHPAGISALPTSNERPPKSGRLARLDVWRILIFHRDLDRPHSFSCNLPSAVPARPLRILVLGYIAAAPVPAPSLSFLLPRHTRPRLPPWRPPLHPRFPSLASTKCSLVRPDPTRLPTPLIPPAEYMMGGPFAPLSDRSSTPRTASSPTVGSRVCLRLPHQVPHSQLVRHTDPS